MLKSMNDDPKSSSSVVSIPEFMYVRNIVMFQFWFIAEIYIFAFPLFSTYVWPVIPLDHYLDFHLCLTGHIFFFCFSLPTHNLPRPHFDICLLLLCVHFICICFHDYPFSMPIIHVYLYPYMRIVICILFHAYLFHMPTVHVLSVLLPTCYDANCAWPNNWVEPMS